jgi:hypothetical protein
VALIILIAKDILMKSLFRIALAGLLASLAFSRPVHAQKTYALGVGGGAAIPVGRLSRTQNTGYNGIVALAIGVAELPIGVRFDGIYATLLNNNPSAGSGTSSDLRITGVLGNLIFAFSGTSAKPYVVVGGGLYNMKADVPGATSDNYFGLNAGLGATFGIGPFATFVESRYHSISRKVADGGVAHFVPITVGLMF